MFNVSDYRAFVVVEWVPQFDRGALPGDSHSRRKNGDGNCQFTLVRSNLGTDAPFQQSPTAVPHGLGCNADWFVCKSLCCSSFCLPPVKGTP